MKAMFDKLAHASIMRLNPASMDKLYDLMTMAVKHQVKSISERSSYLNLFVLLSLSVILSLTHSGHHRQLLDLMTMVVKLQIKIKYESGNTL